jgi:diaminopimelate epimerase
MLWSFTKYHALGNDYIVIDPKNLPSPLTPAQVKLICHRNFGVGSDGILLGPLPSKKAEFGLRIFNPDGSEAEKSGNGLRIFSRYLWDKKIVGSKEFSVETKGGIVHSTVMSRGKIVRVEMGNVSFWSDEIPVAGPRREVINEQIHLRGLQYHFCETNRAAAGNTRTFSEQDERAIDESSGPQKHPDRDLGARRGLHARQRQQQQRVGGSGAQAWPVRPRDFRSYAGRNN